MYFLSCEEIKTTIIIIITIKLQGNKQIIVFLSIETHLIASHYLLT